MQITTARLLRSILSLVAFSLPLSLLILSACGGGGGGGGGTVNPVPNLIGGSGLMVSTFAGTANPGADGVGVAARFNKPGGVVSDGINLYVADTANHIIRKVVIATGAVSTLAGKVGVVGAYDGFGTAATFSSPTGIAIDSTHTNLYVTDSGNNKIRQVMISSGAVTSLTGTPNLADTAGAADGAGLAATFNSPAGIAIDSSNSFLYVVDANNNKIRLVIISTGAVSSLTGATGSAVAAGAADSLSSLSVSFSQPFGITLVSPNLYVADTGNNKIRRVATSNGATSSFTGATNTLVASGVVEGPAASAAFAAPAGITTDGTNLYVADSGNNKIRQITIATPTVSSLTGASGVATTAGYADGLTASATFNAPNGITFYSGNLYVADTNNNTMRQIVGGTVSTLAGNANPGANGTGAGARFFGPDGIISDGVNLYVTDANNHTIRKIVISSGAVTTLAGQSGVSGAADGTGLAASFHGPTGITSDGISLYVADEFNNKIRKITPSSGSLSAMTSATAVVTSFTGAASAADGPGTTATFNRPYGITTDGVSLFVTDMVNNKIRQIAISGVAVTSLTGTPNSAVTAGAADGAATSASFNAPYGIATDGVNLFVADMANNKIRKIAISGVAVTSFTGASGVLVAAGAMDGPAAASSFNAPYGIATDGVNLYVADNGNHKIRQVVIATGAVSSYTGAANTAGAIGYADGTPSAATFFGPSGIAVVGATLYITDGTNNNIRRIQ